MKVKPWYDGRGWNNLFPSKAKAKLLIVLTDSDSMAEQNAVTAAIKVSTVAASQRFMVLHLTHVSTRECYINIEMMNSLQLRHEFYSYC